MRRGCSWPRLCFWLVSLLATPALAGEPSGPKSPFPADGVLDIRLNLPPADWRTLCAQTRRPGAGYATETFGSLGARAFDWFEARVGIEGKTYEGARVRKKGFLGSLDTRRPALKIDLNRAGEKRRFRGLRRLTLNNAKEDPALIRQCLGYGLYRRLGLPAPRCAFAHLRVNDRDLGVYVLVETIDKHFLRRWFGSARGVLLEGTGSDFRPDWIRTFEPKGRTDKAQLAFLHRLADVLQEPDETLLADLKPYLDLPRFLRFWCLEVLLASHDGYASFANNFYVFQARGKTRLHFIPWGRDKIMPYPGSPDPRRPQAVAGGAILPQRLYALPAVRRRYLAQMRSLISSVWDETALTAEARRLAALIQPHLTPAQKKDFAPQLQIVLDFIAQRGRVIAQELAAGDLPMPDKPLPPPTWRVVR